MRLEGLAREYIIPGLLPEVARLALCGTPKHGKSFLALQLAIAVSHGTPFLGFEVAKPGPVLYLQFDTPPELWQERLKELEAAGIDVDTTGCGIYTMHPHTQPRSVNILNGHDAKAIYDQITATLPALVIVDVLRSVHRLSENESEHMQQVVGHLSTICQGRAMLIVHHTGKPSTDPKAVRRSPSTAGRGSSYLGGEMDANWLLSGTQKKRARLEVESRFKAHADLEDCLHLVQNDLGLWNRATPPPKGRPATAQTAYKEATILDPALAELSTREAAERAGLSQSAVSRARHESSKAQ